MTNSSATSPSAAPVSQTDALLDRIDTVLTDNRRIENTYLLCTVGLFVAGIICVISAVVSEEYAWASPSIITTFLLRYPLEKIQKIRQDNIALATAPAIISMLPPAQAAAELQKLIQKLYGDTA